MQELSGTRRVARGLIHLPCALLFILVVAGVARADGPRPLLASGHPVQWWFVFKLNSGKFPGCGAHATRACPFGGTVQPYTSFGQQYIFASDESPQLQPGAGCVGDTSTDPVGATYDEIYSGTYHYVVWNDQFYQDPALESCSGDSCSAPWGHSKGMLAWDNAGEGLVLQVTTPSWPGAGSRTHRRENDDNTLGCVLNNNVKFSQHFFALTLTHEDLIAVLKALSNASVVTDPGNPQIVSNGGPEDIKALVSILGKKTSSTTATITTLSTQVRLISKPSALHVPPWQLVSSLLGAVPLRTATWWGTPQIPTTTPGASIDCWDDALASPGPVQISTTGLWNGKTIGLTAGPAADANHAKIGVSTDGTSSLAIFGDMNQQGAVTGNAKACGRSQNGRGGLFFVVQDAQLSASVADLIRGGTAPSE